MSKFTKEKITDELKAAVRVVSFRKADATLRLMLCTLQSAYLPPPPVVDPSKPAKAKKPANDEVVPVWDLEAKGWRSFRVDAVFSIEEPTDELAALA